MKSASRQLIKWAAIVATILGIISSAAAQTIATYPFEPGARASRLIVGPEGDVWFSLDSKLMRVHNGQLGCVVDMGSATRPAAPLAVSPDGVIYIENCRLAYHWDSGLVFTGSDQPPEPTFIPATFDADARAWCVTFNEEAFFWWDEMNIWEVLPGEQPIKRMFMPRPGGDILAVAADECWIMYWPKYSMHFELRRLDIETGMYRVPYSISGDNACTLRARDHQGRFWMAEPDIAFFDGEDYTIFAEHNITWRLEMYESITLAADGTVWSTYRCVEHYLGVARFRGDERRLFTEADGIYARWCYQAILDYDGNVWVLSWGEGISCISDGGWPPMRLMLREVATGGSIAVEAQVINNGPVVGVDVYIALEQNGQLLYWPNWQPEPSPGQINLRPGHNQTATIISAPRASIPPASYKFWFCMTGRNTQKLIGPIDRKFESLTVEVD